MCPEAQQVERGRRHQERASDRPMEKEGESRQGLLEFGHSNNADTSVFGRATGGLEVVHAIENVRTDKNDKPLEEVRMMSITVE